ncbi:20342_t:CDS:2 [Gigaspora margarita]|uniref:20342_t:CDS:1 n=1 Tax=Gigaspora margarita TaxID=4874 RepID=A0ABN7UW71_GIGMA|nr:20342_t:CDS:2 [Gigaspora margarita]
MASQNKRESGFFDNISLSKNNLQLSKCKDLSIAEKSLIFAIHEFQSSNHHKDLCAKGLEAAKHGLDTLEGIIKLMFPNNPSSNDSSTNEKDDETTVNHRFQEFIEVSEIFQKFKNCFWEAGLFIAYHDCTETEKICRLINDLVQTNEELQNAIEDWKTKQNYWYLIKTKVLAFAKFLVIPNRRLEQYDCEISESQLSKGEIVRGSKGHIVQQIYLGCIRVAEMTICQYDNELLCELKKEIKFMQDLFWGEHNLQTYLANHPDISLTYKLSIARGIANALDFCHENNILHYDVRTANVLLDKYLYPKLYNFKTAKESPVMLKSSSILPETSRWSSPERIRGEEYNNASEVYSFALVMWEIEYQKTPFDTLVSEEEITRKILDGNRPILTSVNGTLAKYQEIIEKSWSQDPSLRPDMKIIHENLNKLIMAYFSEQDADDDEYFGSIVDTGPSNDEILKYLKVGNHNQFSQHSPRSDKIEQGINYHQKKKYKQAWETFQDCHHFNPDDPHANFWVGLYYLKGHHVKKNDQKSMKYLNRASELQHPDAQYWYAYTLLNGPVVFHGNRYMIALKYLRESAMQCHHLALRTLGRIVQIGNYQQKGDFLIGKTMLNVAHKIKIEDRKRITKE